MRNADEIYSFANKQGLAKDFAGLTPFNIIANKLSYWNDEQIIYAFTAQSVNYLNQNLTGVAVAVSDRKIAWSKTKILSADIYIEIPLDNLQLVSFTEKTICLKENSGNIV